MVGIPNKDLTVTVAGRDIEVAIGGAPEPVSITFT